MAASGHAPHLLLELAGAVHQDINKLVLQSGNDSVDTMWRHYHRGTMQAEAKNFWKIRPPRLKPTTNVIPLAQVA
jgi:hypothetical protein